MSNKIIRMAAIVETYNSVGFYARFLSIVPGYLTMVAGNKKRRFVCNNVEQSGTWEHFNEPRITEIGVCISGHKWYFLFLLFHVLISMAV